MEGEDTAVVEPVIDRSMGTLTELSTGMVKDAHGSQERCRQPVRDEIELLRYDDAKVIHCRGDGVLPVVVPQIAPGEERVESGEIDVEMEACCYTSRCCGLCLARSHRDGGRVLPVVIP